MSTQAIRQFVRDYYNVVDNEYLRIKEFYAPNARLTFGGFVSEGNEAIQTFFNNFNRPDGHTIEFIDVQETEDPNIFVALIKATAIYNAAENMSYGQSVIIRKNGNSFEYLNSIVR